MVNMFRSTRNNTKQLKTTHFLCCRVKKTNRAEIGDELLGSSIRGFLCRPLINASEWLTVRYKFNSCSTVTHILYRNVSTGHSADAIYTSTTTCYSRISSVFTSSRKTWTNRLVNDDSMSTAQTNKNHNEPTGLV